MLLRKKSYVQPCFIKLFTIQGYTLHGSDSVTCQLSFPFDDSQSNAADDHQSPPTTTIEITENGSGDGGVLATPSRKDISQLMDKSESVLDVNNVIFLISLFTTILFSLLFSMDLFYYTMLVTSLLFYGSVTLTIYLCGNFKLV